ncbi:hypothetical protein VKT23_020470 [Stygiomarasmius scandens]|uniref:Uncharacterized protein n=1 Tax=Marasmiellus scandens TaxID=2682957 RepID=A0ABR1IME2_9AGAR
MKADVWQIRAEYEKKMEAVALRYNHSLQSAYRAAGEIAVVSRDPNLFNIFEKWWVAEDGNNGKVPESTNPGTFLSQKWKDCRQESLGEDWDDSDKVEGAFRYLRAWHLERYNNSLKVAKGPTKHDVKAVAKIVSDVAKQSAFNRGIWVLAYVLDPFGQHSMVSGWGKPYEAVKLEYATQLTSQLHDISVLYGSENLKLMASSGVDPKLKDLVVAAAKVGTDRASEQAIVPKMLLYDIGAYTFLYKFPWSRFPDLALRCQFRIENWPEDIPAPGAGLRDITQAIPKSGGPLAAARIKELLWYKEAWERKEENVTPPESITSKVLRIVSWSNEEKNLPPDEQKDIALVKCIDGRTLTSAVHSKEWRKEQGLLIDGKNNKKSRKRTRTTSSSERSPSPPPHLEEGIPPFNFSEEEDTTLCRHPNPSPFSSPIREPSTTHIPAGRRLFIGAEKQQQFLESSDITPSDGYEGDDDIPLYSQQPRSKHLPQLHEAQVYCSHMYADAQPGLPIPVQRMPINTRTHALTKHSDFRSLVPPSVPPPFENPRTYAEPRLPQTQMHPGSHRLPYQRPSPVQHAQGSSSLPVTRDQKSTSETMVGHSGHIRSMKCPREKNQQPESRPAKKTMTGKPFKQYLLKNCK